MTNFLATVDGEVDWAVEGYTQMRYGYQDIHFLSPELSSWHHLAEFDDVDKGLEAVTDREHQDYDDEDGNISPSELGSPSNCVWGFPEYLL